MAANRVFLVGLSGAGKSTVGRILADHLGWEFIDSDERVEQKAGRNIEALFASLGEPAFRALEADVLEELSSRDRVVIATGGGAPTYEKSRRAIAKGVAVWLDVTPEQAARRLAADPVTEARPLLAGDPLLRLDELFAERRHYYEMAPHSVAVDYYNPSQVAERIAGILAAGAGGDAISMAAADRAGWGGAEAARVVTNTSSYPIYVRAGSAGSTGDICRNLGLKGRAFIVSDGVFLDLHGRSVEASLSAAGYQTRSHAIAPGEQNKTLETVAGIYEWLLEARVERSDFVVCLGGGVVTDVGGFAAATVLRGVDFIHVPTTMAGMVDAAIGGKTGVDHPRGKNMVGAFSQPRAVIVDPAVLETLPERHIRAGVAELIKHGFILDGELVTRLEATGGDLSRLVADDLLARSVAIKARIVSGDEREGGARTLLNYGHTVGHAIETVTGYGRYLHGEGVAVGMRAAGLISVALGRLSPEEFERQQSLVRVCGLPDEVSGVTADQVIEATLGDKKIRGGRVNWVLLERLGAAFTSRDVPGDVIREAVEQVVGGE